MSSGTSNTGSSNSGTENDRVFETLLDYLRRSRGFDFTGYKRSSLKRRVTKQMRLRELETYSDYLDYLQVHQEEFYELFNTILINVTAFFRDKPAWNYLWHHTLTNILQNKDDASPIRIWCAGCASGEEAYTLAIVLAELLGAHQYRQRVKIYATDVDENALAQARHASYTAKDIEPIPAELREKYFEPARDRFVFRQDLRRSVIFGRHDLVQDAPISRLDLLSCRNTLMYFNSETQGRILARFHFALKETGALFLGKAEMLMTHSNLFSPLSIQHRIFAKVPSVNLRDRLLVLAQTGSDDAGITLANQVRLQDAAFHNSPIAQIVVDFNGALILANSSACTQFHINTQDLGRPLQDLEVSYRPLELRSLIEQVYSEGAQLEVLNVTRTISEDETQYIDVQLTPLRENGSDILGVSITFADVTRYNYLQIEHERSNQELETTNEELQSSNEELETTNEELQSTNEELETTNEELQSTNEELETMNEELQSTNEELQTINEELRLRTGELNQANAFLQSIFASIKMGLIVIDRQMNILAWNYESENLWGLRADEVSHQSLFGLDIGLPVDRLRDPIRSSLSGAEPYETTVDALNRRGQAIRCKITFDPLVGTEGPNRGVILLVEPLNPDI